MRPVSAAFLAAVRASHDVAVRARVVQAGLSGVNPPGTLIPILSGDVRLDAAADVRSTVDLTTDGTGMWPRSNTALFAPYGNELFVERGLRVAAAIEWVSLGYHRIESPSQDRPPDGPLRITGSDRMAGIIDARLLAPRQFTAAETYGSVVGDLVREVYPAAHIEWDDTTEARTLGRALIVEEDRHGFLAELVRAIGKIWYWDHRGILLVRDPPDATTAVFDVEAGAGGVLISSTRSLTREGVYNAVVASGEAADTEDPARGVAVDANPASPTYFHGPFGPVPRFFTSPFLLTDGQAVSAAAAILRRELGLPYNVDLTAVPNPALEPWDPVRIRHATTEGAEMHIIQTLTIPLTATAAMTATTREQTRVLVGTSS